ncbi:ribonuclease T(2) [Mycobacterium sp. DL592]|uniref:ribonuclease T2 family protein n=1 Tax=Mycobacterium sp. DL592 TaxID=2675524 RepID=UPI001FB9BC11|nr:ribonuclease T(2) [Mycobacterium sp. DL592]
MAFRINSRRWRRAALVTAVVAAVVLAVVWVVNRPRQPPGDTVANSTSSLLVMTWGPSLCTLERSNSGCRSGHVGALGPTLILHGLWPQPSTERSCPLPNGQRDASLPALNLPPNLQADLQSKMSDVAILAPHEWKAHGTCSGVTAQEYFQISASLAGQAIPVLNPAFQNTPDGRVSVETLRQLVGAAFGPEAAKRVSLRCRGDNGQAVAYEVQLSLPPVSALVRDSASLRDVVTRGPTLSGGCRRGSVPR